VRITRLYLRNYRVYEELDLEMPAGLVGVFGPNGAGKSALLESLLWTLWGRSRTRNEEIRTTGVNADCISEVEFEHEGHLYSVRRTITGINSTVKAEAFADRLQVANGVRDVKQYVHSVLGMDDAAFRASVFAEQKQVAAFSTKTPKERRDLVLKLLGITPLDGARDAARRDAKVARDDVDRLRGMLPDLDDLRPRVEQAAAAAETAAADATSEQVAAATAKRTLEAAETAFVSLDEVRQEHDALVREGKAARAEVEQAAARVATLTDELAQLAAADAELAALAHTADPARLEAAESELRLVTAVATAALAVEKLGPVAAAPAAPDDAALEEARSAAADVKARLDTVTGQQQGARSEVDRARAQLDRSASLSAEGACPVCGQELGEAFAQVQAHRAAEVTEAEARLHALAEEAAQLAGQAEAAVATLRSVQAAHTAAGAAWKAYEQQHARRTAAEAALTTAVDALGRPVADGEAARLEADVAARRQALRRAAQLEGALQRKPVAEAQLVDERERHASAEGRRAALLDKVRALAYDPAKLDELRSARDEARARAERAAGAADNARLVAERARVQAEAEAQRLADAEAQHAHLADRSEEARHLGRMAELLNAFRTNVVATVGPRLSAQAAELFDELTDSEYDLLQVDPETYEIQIVDGGRAFGMDRFSGSETDLANLALRVAISEHVRFQSGGAVGLLVLDEVFGPLDDERKERMLLALERLRARFGQVLVVTHASEIKEQLPGAIEVVKLPGRRATARVVGV
jgi:exonuclease SbcC